MKEQTCCFTGHRKIPDQIRPDIQKRLEEEITNLIHQGVTEFRAGGALGFDTMAALAVLKLKKMFTRIRLILVLPCWEQPDKWSENDQKRYAIIRVQADEVVYTSWLYRHGCMHKRNRHLIGNSGICICYLTKAKGGTAYTVNYAKQKGVRVINLALDEKAFVIGGSPYGHPL